MNREKRDRTGSNSGSNFSFYISLKIFLVILVFDGFRNRIKCQICEVKWLHVDEKRENCVKIRVEALKTAEKRSKKKLRRGNMNNEKSSIHQEYEQIQEKNQWMSFYQVRSSSRIVLSEFLANHIRHNSVIYSFRRMWKMQAKLRRKTAITRPMSRRRHRISAWTGNARRSPRR